MTSLNRAWKVVVALHRKTRYRRFLIISETIFLVLFLTATNQLSVSGSSAASFQVAENTAKKVFHQTNPFQFEPILKIHVYRLTYYFNPVDLVIALTLAILTGLNLTMTYAAIRQPQACSVSKSRSFFVALPALLAGSACCAPSIVLILGLQITSAFIAIFSYLLPVAFLLLLANMLWSAQQVNHERLE